MSSDDVIDALFNRTVAIAQSLPAVGPIQTSYEEKLALYSLYKQATEGDVSSPRPRLLDMLGRAKWDAWATRRGLSSRDAKQLYVESMLRTLRRFRDRPAAMALIDELENFSGQVAEQVMDSALASSEEDYTDSESVTEDESAYDDEQEEDEQVPVPGAVQERDPRVQPRAQPPGLSPRPRPRARAQPQPQPQAQPQRQIEAATDADQESYSESEGEEQRQSELQTARSITARSFASASVQPARSGSPGRAPPGRYQSTSGYAAGSSTPGATSIPPGLASPPVERRPPPSLSASLAGRYAGSAHGSALEPTGARPSESRLYGLPGRSAAGYPPSESLAGQAAGGFNSSHLPPTTGGMYRPANAPTGASSYSYGAASSVGGRSAGLRRPQPGDQPRLSRISDTGSAPGSNHASAAAASHRADAVDMALQRIQASLAGLHERMTAVETRSSSSSGGWLTGRVGATNGNGAEGDGARGALAQLARVLLGAIQDLGFLLGLTSGVGAGTVAPSYAAASNTSTARRQTGSANARSVREALSNVLLSAPLRIAGALLFLAARLALDVLSVGLFVTGILFLVRRLAGRGDPLLLLRILGGWTRALRGSSTRGIPSVAAAAAAAAAPVAA